MAEAPGHAAGMLSTEVNDVKLLRRRKHNAMDDTTWEFLHPAWLATHAVAFGGICALVWAATSRRR
jgi:hypothetical protein